MGSINSALTVMKGALEADQKALSIVANNVANANTPGYTEETPTWQQNAPIEVGGVSVGDGVTETGATSQRSRVLEERLDQQQQMASASSTRLAALNDIQALFTPDTGSSTANAETSEATSPTSLIRSRLSRATRQTTPCESRCFRRR